MPEKKYTQEQKELAVARLTLGDRPSVIARDLGIPSGTVRYWKYNLVKIKKQDGSLGYHAEEKKKFVEKAWKIIHDALDLLEKRLRDVDKPKDLAIILGILYDKNIRAMPPAEGRSKAIDLSDWSTERLRVVVAEFERKATAALEPAEVIEGKVKEITL